MLPNKMDTTTTIGATVKNLMSTQVRNNAFLKSRHYLLNWTNVIQIVTYRSLSDAPNTRGNGYNCLILYFLYYINVSISLCFMFSHWEALKLKSI